MFCSVVNCTNGLASFGLMKSEHLIFTFAAHPLPSSALLPSARSSFMLANVVRPVRTPVTNERTELTRRFGRSTGRSGCVCFSIKRSTASRGLVFSSKMLFAVSISGACTLSFRASWHAAGAVYTPSATPCRDCLRSSRMSFSGLPLLASSYPTFLFLQYTANKE